MTTHTWTVSLPGYLGRGTIREYVFTTRTTPRGVCVEREGKRHYVVRLPEGGYRCRCVFAKSPSGCIHIDLARQHDERERAPSGAPGEGVLL